MGTKFKRKPHLLTKTRVENEGPQSSESKGQNAEKDRARFSGTWLGGVSEDRSEARSVGAKGREKKVQCMPEMPRCV